MLLTAAQENASVAGPVLVFLLLGASTLIGFGYLVAVMRRANDDYKKTKASLPGMRKSFWQAWWAAVKVGFFVFIGFIVLVAWFADEVRDDDAPPRPAVSAGTR